MQWQDRSTPCSVATETRKHDGRTYAIDAYRDSESIALHAHAGPSMSWSPLDQRIARIEIRTSLRADAPDEYVRRVCDELGEMCATLAREAER
jgi:hypothetical protein